MGRRQRLILDFARPEDGGDILEILEENEYPGRVALIYTRRPDPLHSFALEGDPVDVFVSRDPQAGRIASIGACAAREVFVNGEPMRIGYLFALHTRTAYQGRYPTFHKAFEVVRKQREARGIRFHLSSVLEENHRARMLFAKRRAILPRYDPIGTYTVHTMVSRRRASLPKGMRLRQAAPEDLSRVVDFLQTQGSRWQFFPVLGEADLREQRFGVGIEDFRILEHNGAPVAMGAVWDQRRYKQYIVRRYTGMLKYLYPISGVFPAFRAPRLPRPGSPLNFFTLAFWATRDGETELFGNLLDAVAARERGYPYFVAGVPDGHPFAAVARRRSRIRYRSIIYLVTWEETRAAAEQLNAARYPYLECGML